MHLVQEIGAYAGLGAILGLAVLSALYFSQARDLKRLREWAGRAPERAAEIEARAEATARAAREAERGVTVEREGEAARPAVAQPAAAVAAGQEAGGQPAPVEQGEGEPAGSPAATAATGAPPEDAEAPAGAPAGAPEAGGNGAVESGPTVERDIPSLPRTGPGIPPPPAFDPAATAQPRPRRARWYRRIRLRYFALVVGGVLVVGAAAVFAISRLDEGSQQPGQAGAPATEGARTARHRATLVPSQITFAVLNGTTVDGLAKRVADRLETAGFRRGNVTNATAQKAESVVLYATGARRQAAAVGRRLGISQSERVDPASQALAGDATVIVVVGNDLNR
jgi:LytR cell envelope-related transcriptional attenuator